MVLKKNNILLILSFLVLGFMCACGKEDSDTGELLVEKIEDASSEETTKSAEEKAEEQWNKISYYTSKNTIFFTA